MVSPKQFIELMKAAGCETKKDCIEFYNGFMSKNAAIEFGDFFKSIITGIGGTLGSEAVKGTFKGIESAVRTTPEMKLSARHKTFIENLIKSDQILKSRKPEIIISHYETLVRMAPSISLDQNAVSAFLRYSTQHEGIDTSMLRQLAELEGKVNQNITSNRWF